jgi:HEAT repeat protein
MTHTKAAYEDRLRTVVDRMPQRLRPHAHRDLRSLVARAPSLRDVRELASSKNADPEVRARAIWALGVLSERGAKRLLLSILADDTSDDLVLWEAGKSLVRLGVAESAVQPLSRMLRKGTVEQWKVAAWVLGMGARSAVARRALEATVTDEKEHVDVRSHAAEALGTLARKASVKVLLKSLSDPEPMVRFWGAYALGEIGDRRAVRALREIASDKSRIKGFHSVGAEARSAIKRITQQQNQSSHQRRSKDKSSKI